MLCPKCGKELEQDTIFCDACGEFLKPQSATQSAASDRKPKKANFKNKVIIVAVILCVIAVISVVIGIIVAGRNDTQASASTDNVSSTEESVGTDSSEDIVSSENSSTSSQTKKTLKEKELVGEWEFDLSFKEINSAKWKEQYGAFETDASFSAILRFNEDKTVVLVCRKDDYVSAYASFVDDYITYLRNGGLYALYEADGMSKEDVDEALAEKGMTAELFIDDVEQSLRDKDITTDMTVDSEGYILLTDQSKTTKYTLEKKNVITFITDNDVTKETYIKCDYFGETMTVTEGSYAGNMLINKSMKKLS